MDKIKEVLLVFITFHAILVEFLAIESYSLDRVWFGSVSYGLPLQRLQCSIHLKKICTMIYNIIFMKCVLRLSLFLLYPWTK